MNGMSDANGGDAKLDSMNWSWRSLETNGRRYFEIFNYEFVSKYWPYVIPNQTETDIPRQWPLNLSQKT